MVKVHVGAIWVEGDSFKGDELEEDLVEGDSAGRDPLVGDSVGGDSVEGDEIEGDELKGDSAEGGEEGLGDPAVVRLPRIFAAPPLFPAQKPAQPKLSTIFLDTLASLDFTLVSETLGRVSILNIFEM